MKYSVTLHEKPIEVKLSRRAEKALSKRDQPIIAEISLIFGCLVLKRVWFKEGVSLETVPVTEKLELCFNAVRYDKCTLISDIDNGAIPEEFPIEKDADKFIPDYLFIDFKQGDFTGEYTYKN